VTAATVEVVTAVAASTVSLGYTAGAVSSFCSAQTAATAGFFSCSSTLNVSVGTTASTLLWVTTNHDINGFLYTYYRVAGGN